MLCVQFCDQNTAFDLNSIEDMDKVFCISHVDKCKLFGRVHLFHCCYPLFHLFLFLEAKTPLQIASDSDVSIKVIK